MTAAPRFPFFSSPSTKHPSPRRPLATFSRPGVLFSGTLPPLPSALKSSASANFRRALEQSRRLPGSYSFHRQRPSLRGQRHPLHRSPLPARNRERCFLRRSRPATRRRRSLADRRHREFGENFPEPPRNGSEAGAALPVKFMFRRGRTRRRRRQPRRRRLPLAGAGALRPSRAPFLFEAFGQRSPLAGEGFFAPLSTRGPGSSKLPGGARSLAGEIARRGRQHPFGTPGATSGPSFQLLTLLTLGRLPRFPGAGISRRRRNFFPRRRELGAMLRRPALLPRGPRRRALARALASLLPALARASVHRRTALARLLTPALARRRSPAPGPGHRKTRTAALRRRFPRSPAASQNPRGRRRAPLFLTLAGGVLARNRYTRLALPAPLWRRGLGGAAMTASRRRRLLRACLRRRRFPRRLVAASAPGLLARPDCRRRRLGFQSLWSVRRRRWLRRSPLARPRALRPSRLRSSARRRESLALRRSALGTLARSWRRLLAGASALPGSGESWSQWGRRRRRLAKVLPRKTGAFGELSAPLATPAPEAFGARPLPPSPALAFGQRRLGWQRSAGECNPSTPLARALVSATGALSRVALRPAGERLLHRGWNPPLAKASPTAPPQPAFGACQSASRRSQRVRPPLRRLRRRRQLRGEAIAFRRALLQRGSRRLGRRRSVRAALREVAERHSRRRSTAGEGASTSSPEEVTPRRSRELYQLLRRRLSQPRRRRLRRHRATLALAATRRQGRPRELAPAFGALATLRRRRAALAAAALVALPATAPAASYHLLRGTLLAAGADGLALDSGRLGGLSPRGRWNIHGFTPYWELDDEGTAPFRREFAFLEEGLLTGSPGLLTFLPGESNGSSLGLGQLPRSHSLWLFRSKLFWYYLAVIISPRRNNVRCTVQPQGGPLAVRNRRRLVHLSAGLLPGHRRGRQRRSLDTRRELYRRAAFRLLRFAKYRSHYRFLLFKTPHLLAGLSDRRSPGGLHWDLRQIFGPFVERRLYKLLPPAEAWSVRSTPPHFGASRLGQPRRSRKHPPRLKRLSF